MCLCSSQFLVIRCRDDSDIVSLLVQREDVDAWALSGLALDCARQECHFGVVKALLQDDKVLNRVRANAGLSSCTLVKRAISELKEERYAMLYSLVALWRGRVTSELGTRIALLVFSDQLNGASEHLKRAQIQALMRRLPKSLMQQ